MALLHDHVLISEGRTHWRALLNQARMSKGNQELCMALQLLLLLYGQKSKAVSMADRSNNEQTEL